MSCVLEPRSARERRARAGLCTRERMQPRASTPMQHREQHRNASRRRAADRGWGAGPARVGAGQRCTLNVSREARVRTIIHIYIIAVLWRHRRRRISARHDNVIAAVMALLCPRWRSSRGRQSRDGQHSGQGRGIVHQRRTRLRPEDQIVSLTHTGRPSPQTRTTKDLVLRLSAA